MVIELQIASRHLWFLSIIFPKGLACISCRRGMWGWVNAPVIYRSPHKLLFAPGSSTQFVNSYR